MNIYKEAARRYDGGVFKFPDCPECGAKFTEVSHVGNDYVCDVCDHRWLKRTHRQMAEALWAGCIRLSSAPTAGNTAQVKTIVRSARWTGGRCEPR
jgi:DNA-directed RNA polymerase subunit RPC12/RpoP